MADVEAHLRLLREGPNHFVKDDGTEIPVGYGTRYYDADWEYYQAVQWAVGTAVSEKAEELGLDDNGHTSNAGEIQCASSFDPSMPPWQPQLEGGTGVDH